MHHPIANQYSGDFVAWQGVCGFIGAGGGPPPAPHSHYAIQLAIEYDPQPPFDSGSLAKADEATKARAVEYARARK